MSTRDRYLAMLVGVALVLAMAHHLYGVGWLTFLFPAMGVLFAAGGAAAAGALDSEPAARAVRNRLRGLLLPFWALGLVVVPAMLWHGSLPRGLDLAYWVVPVLAPPDATGVLWYVRASLWFVLLSPLALAAFRRWPVMTVLAPLALVVLPSVGVVDLTALGPLGNGLVDAGTYGSCWVLGFAHRAGLVRRVPWPGVAGLAVGAMLLGAAYALVRPHPAHGFDLVAIPLAQAPWCLGATLLLLRLASPRDGHDPMPRLLAVVEARALTWFLWHGVAVALAGSVDDRLEIPPAVGTATPWLLAATAVLLFGWIEDYAAGRRPTLLPGARRDVGSLLLGGRWPEAGRLGP